MVELLKAYSLEQIVLFIILLAAGIKKAIETIDFYRKRGKEAIKKEEEINGCITMGRQLMESLDNINSRINTLTQSDMDDIRSWMIEKLNYYKKNPNEKIDEFTMDVIERRFATYLEEGGNSYICSVVEQLRDLYKED